MSLDDTRKMLARLETAFARSPRTARHADAPATARWAATGLRVVARHPNGHAVESDMPSQFGGSDDAVTPGWLFRAGLASCAATSIVLTAAAEAIVLDEIEVRADSSSDTRGLLGMREDDGRRIDPSSTQLKLHISLRASHASARRLCELVHEGLSRSPIPGCLGKASRIEVTIDAGNVGDDDAADGAANSEAKGADTPPH